MPTLPRLLHARLRASQFYAARTDSLTFQAQSQRVAKRNADENRGKLMEEVIKIYDDVVPGESRPDKAGKFRAVWVGCLVRPWL